MKTFPLTQMEITYIEEDLDVQDIEYNIYSCTRFY